MVGLIFSHNHSCKTIQEVETVRAYIEEDESEDDVRRICEKRGKTLSGREKKIEDHALETAELVDHYGSLAALVLAGKNLSLNEVEEILSQNALVDDRLLELILDAERKALTKRFW